MNVLSGPKGQQDKMENFLSLTGTLYVFVNSWKNQVLEEDILNHIVQCGFAGIHGYPEYAGCHACHTVAENHHRLWKPDPRDTV